MRPRLKAALPPLWRAPDVVQFGLDPVRALVVAGVPAGAAQLLAVLDGRRTWAETLAAGTPAERELLVLLAEGGALEDATTVAAGGGPERALLTLTHTQAADAVAAVRRATRVLIVGGGRVGASLAHLLGACGLGRVSVEDRAPATAADACPGGLSLTDAGLRRGAAATALAVRAGPPVLANGPPHLAVFCADDAVPPDAARWRPLLAAGVPLLTVAVRETTLVVGPLTLPGRSACPGCLDWHRTERDAGWPTLAGQLGGAASTAGAAAVATLAGAAAHQVLAWVDARATAPPAGPGASGPPAEPALGCLDATLELALPGWRWQRRWWGRHPACPCRRLAGAAPPGAAMRPDGARRAPGGPE